MPGQGFQNSPLKFVWKNADLSEEIEGFISIEVACSSEIIVVFMFYKMNQVYFKVNKICTLDVFLFTMNYFFNENFQGRFPEMLRKHFKIGMFLSLMLVPAAISAGPKISVDSADFDIGTIHEGQFKSIKHTFKVKNTGDSVLVIQSVKPG